MVNHERVQIFIDGGNFHYLALKPLNARELDFSFEDFAVFLSNNRMISDGGKRYYIGTVREREGNPRSKEAMSLQTQLFAMLKRYKWQIKTSKLRTRTEQVIIDERVVGYQELRKKGVRVVEFERTREKGIDVKLATDLIVGAVDDQYDTAIIVSSDTDLMPAMDWVRYRMKKRIEYVGFSLLDFHGSGTKPVHAFITHSDIQRILVASDLKLFIKSVE